MTALRRTFAVVAATATIATFGMTATPAQAADDVTVQILGINDLHGRLVENADEWVAVHLAAAVEHASATNPNTVFLSAGDNIGASTFVSAYSPDGTSDNPTIAALNAMGLEASALGNHEFDNGLAILRDRIAGTNGYTKTDFPYLGANVYDKGTTNPVFPEYTLIDRPDVTIGVVGVVTAETAVMASVETNSLVDFGDPVVAANRAAAAATAAGADVVILMAHEGAAESASQQTLTQQIARNDNFSRIITQTSADVDVIFSGHTHKEYAWDEGPIPGSSATRPIVQTGEYGKNLGVVTLTIDGNSGEVTAHSARLDKVPDAKAVTAGATPMSELIADPTLPRTTAVHGIVGSAKDASDVVGQQKVGSVSADIMRARTPDGKEDRGQESTIGHLYATMLLTSVREQVTRPGVDPDMAMFGPGGLRADLPYGTDGSITFAQVNAVAPFANQVVVLSILGRDLLDALEQQWQPDGASRPYLANAFAGLSYHYDPSRPRGERISADTVVINGEPFDPDRTYQVITTPFQANGGDSFTALTRGTWVDTGLIDTDLLVAWFRDHSPVAPDPNNRALLDDRDVVAASLNLTATTVNPGDQLSIDVDVTATRAVSGPVTATVTAGSEVVGTIDFAELTADAPTSTSMDWTVPADAAGDVTLTVVVDGTTLPGGVRTSTTVNVVRAAVPSATGTGGGAGTATSGTAPTSGALPSTGAMVPATVILSLLLVGAVLIAVRSRRSEQRR